MLFPLSYYVAYTKMTAEMTLDFYREILSMKVSSQLASFHINTLLIKAQEKNAKYMTINSIHFVSPSCALLLTPMSAHHQPVYQDPNLLLKSTHTRKLLFTVINKSYSNSLLSLSVLFSICSSGSKCDRYKWKCQQWSSYPILSAG